MHNHIGSNKNATKYEIQSSKNGCGALSMKDLINFDRVSAYL